MKRSSFAAGVFVACIAFASCKKSEAPPASGAPASPPAAEAPKSVVTPAPTAAPAEQPPSSAPGGSPTDEDSKAKARDKDALTPEPKTLAEAEAELERARADFGKLTLQDKGGGGKTGAAPLAAGDSRCPEACKAMSSLRRAAKAVCRLAGDDSTRCKRAKDIVGESEGRITACKCAED